MKYVKTIGLAALAALAAMMIAGAGTASADTACLSDPAAEECPEEDRYTGSIEGLDPEATLTASGGLEVICHSKVLANWIKNEGSHVGVLYLITELSFTECKGSCNGVKEGKAENLPFWALADALEGHLLVWPQENPELHASALLVGCTIFNVNCLYETEAEKALLEYELVNTTDGGAFKAKELPLKRSNHSLLCPEKGTWDALYPIKEDDPESLAPLWLKALP